MELKVKEGRHRRAGIYRHERYLNQIWINIGKVDFDHTDHLVLPKYHDILSQQEFTKQDFDSILSFVKNETISLRENRCIDDDTALRICIFTCCLACPWFVTRDEDDKVLVKQIATSIHQFNHPQWKISFPQWKISFENCSKTYEASVGNQWIDPKGNIYIVDGKPLKPFNACHRFSQGLI